jgi:hypothetical protein
MRWSNSDGFINDNLLLAVVGETATTAKKIKTPKP